MALVDIESVDVFTEGVMRVYEVERREIGVVKWQGEWFAIRNLCPHLGARICSGPVQPFLSESGAWDADLLVDYSRPVVACPWHHWEFELRTGAMVSGPERIRTYPVVVEGGRVLIDLGSSRAPAPST